MRATNCLSILSRRRPVGDVVLGLDYIRFSLLFWKLTEFWDTLWLYKLERVSPMSNVNIEYRRPEYEEGEPDGSRCSMCGEQIFLKQFYPILRFGHSKAVASSARFCQGCVEFVRDGNRPPEEDYEHAGQ